MAILTFNGMKREELRQSDIDNLLRKGWSIEPVLTRPDAPEFDPEVEFLQYEEETNSYKIRNLPEEEIRNLAKIKKLQILDGHIDNGFLVQPENFILALSDSDRAAFSQMLSLVKEALDLGLITNDTPQTIADKDGQKHEVSTLRFRQIMVQYGFYYKSLWDQMS